MAEETDGIPDPDTASERKARERIRASPSATGIQKRQAPSDARKLQNRASSQTYRKRQRQKLALLDQLLVAETSDTAGAILTSSEPSQPLGQHDGYATHAEGSSSLSHARSGMVTVSNVCEQDATSHEAWYGDITAFWHSDTIMGSEASDHGLVTQPDEVTASQNQVSFFSPGPYSMTVIPLGEWQMEKPGSHRSDPAAASPRTFPPTSIRLADVRQPEQNMSQVVRSISSLSLQEKRQLLGILQSDLESDAVTAATQSRQTSLPATHYSTATDSDAQPNVYSSLDLWSHVNEAARFNSWLHSRCLISQPSYFGVDPKSTTLRLSSFSFWDALVANADAIQLASQELGKQNGRSPFNAGIANVRELSQARAIHNAVVPRDLRPTDAQLTHPHHPYLDLIPFASFRQRAVGALAASPPLIDEKQMCADINAAGMICWGGAGDGNINMAFRMPWDARSWEPKIWFLKKYWFLVGGWDDEMWTSARWWAGMRSEHITYS